MSDAVETYAGPQAWWEGISPTVRERVILDKNLTGKEMLEAASIDWTVSKQPLFVTGEHAVKVPFYMAVQRDSDGAVLGVVRDTYQTINNEALAELGDAIRDNGGADWHTAGSLFEGRVVWMLAKLDKDIYIRGDESPIEDYLLLTTGHDGRHAVTAHQTPMRVVCANTLTAAIGASKTSYSMKHTANVQVRIEEARKALDIHFKYVQSMEDFLNSLADKPMTFDEVTRFTEVLLPANPQSEHPYKTEAAREGILALYRNSQTLVGVPDTAYRAYQAVAEYTDHVQKYGDTKKSKGEDRRALSIIEGPALAVKSRAARLLVKA
jgi:phage/plasmid-like protein (TIGR03299 family)